MEDELLTQISNWEKVTANNVKKMKGLKQKEFLIQNFYINIENRCSSPRNGQKIDLLTILDNFECELINDKINTSNLIKFSIIDSEKEYKIYKGECNNITFSSENTYKLKMVNSDILKLFMCSISFNDVGHFHVSDKHKKYKPEVGVISISCPLILSVDGIDVCASYELHIIPNKEDV